MFVTNLFPRESGRESSFLTLLLRNRKSTHRGATTTARKSGTFFIFFNTEVRMNENRFSKIRLKHKWTIIICDNTYVCNKKSQWSRGMIRL